MREDECRRYRNGANREVGISTVHGSGQRGVHADGRAIVAVVVRVVVALLLAGIDQAGHGRVEHAHHPIRASREAPATDEDEHAGGCRFDPASTPIVPAGDVGERDPVGDEDRPHGQHGRDGR
jgi:hypothetical protein